MHSALEAQCKVHTLHSDLGVPYIAPVLLVMFIGCAEEGQNRFAGDMHSGLRVSVNLS